MRHLILFGLFIAAPARFAAAQSDPGVSVPPIELGTSFSLDLHGSSSTTNVIPGGVLAVNGNLARHLAVTTEVGGTSHHVTAMAGPRLTTGFFREAGSTGRFFLEALAGVEHRRNSGVNAAAMLVGAGADVLIGPPGVSLHWALDYMFQPRGLPHYTGGRFTVGLVLGPRIVK